MTKVAIIGAGLVGRSWAITLARAGHRVVLWDADSAAPAAAVAFIRRVLPDLADHDLLDGQSPEAVLSHIAIAGDMAAAVAGAAHIQESTPEQLDVKESVFAELDTLAAGDAVLASSTSAILPSRFTERLAGRHRCLVVHPINPPYLIPAVELVPAPWTSPEVVTRTRDFLTAAGHAPIVMKREIDGFLINRMQGALLEEAFRLVAGGYATAEDVDIGLREGLALRWSFMGPFETIDLNAPGGVRDYVLRYQGIYEGIFAQTGWRADWAGEVLESVERDRRKKLPEAALGERQLWRDRRLMALAAHKRRVAKEIGE
jgi:3-hydroxyacyl-CoA dehydrogenase